MCASLRSCFFPFSRSPKWLRRHLHGPSQRSLSFEDNGTRDYWVLLRMPSCAVVNCGRAWDLRVNTYWLAYPKPRTCNQRKPDQWLHIMLGLQRRLMSCLTL